MPFGTVYAALFFTAIAIWLAAGGAGGQGLPAAVVRASLALLGLSLAVGLGLRRGWARWTGVLFALVLVVLLLGVAARQESATVFLALFGTLAAAGLLIVPVTGDATRGRDPAARSAVGFGRGVAVAALIGLVGVLTGAWWDARIPAPGTAVGERAALPAAARMPPRVRWSDFGAGLEASRGASRPILATFVAGWCGYCRKMDRETWRDPEVVERMQDVVAVRVDGEETSEKNGFRGAELAARYGVNGYPTLLLLDEEGQVLSRISGYLAPDQFLAWLDSSVPRAAGPSGHSFP